MSEEKEMRDTRVVIYMTRDDADYLNRITKSFGMKSRSTLIVAILERLCMGGFSVASFFKVGSQLEKRAKEHPDGDQYEFDFDAIKAALRPFPALPVEDDPTPKEVQAGLKEIREELIAK